ncbi:DNA repair protein RadC, partial [candidate division WWE3 bacterium]|nr:DNA repair protein RadC [candidate division WWE3 bacterium]
MRRAKINQLAPILRPRERLFRYGPEVLSNEELIAILLGSGTRESSVLELAHRISAEFLGNTLKNISPEKIKSIAGIGPAKASQLAAGIELGKRIALDKKTQLHLTPHDIFDSLTTIRKSRKEHFVVFFLDARNQEIKKETISIGTVDTSLVHPREVFEPAVRYTASSIILVHNHPSGDLTPSDADLQTTKRLVTAGDILGITIQD